MNPYRIYRDEWARALCQQATARAYETFVAMPFAESENYQSREVLQHVLGRAADLATSWDSARLPFKAPTRADSREGPASSAVITEEIAVQILEAHIFVGDLTLGNPGVILETGIALGMKPSTQIILITQGDLGGVHFDLRNNEVVQYVPHGPVDQIATKLVRAAATFEEHMGRYLARVTERLTSDAHALLNFYGVIRQDRRGVLSLHRGNMGPNFPAGEDGSVRRFDNAVRELLALELLWTDYRAAAAEGRDLFGMHATDLGWAVIERIWSDLKRPVPDVSAPSTSGETNKGRPGGSNDGDVPSRDLASSIPNDC